MLKTSQLIIAAIAVVMLLCWAALPGQAQTGETSIPTATTYIQPLVTSTPDANGNVVHIVQYGEALISIAQAYAVSISDLKAMNDLESDSIYVGQQLIIRLGATATITSIPTRTATSTHHPTSTPKPKTPTPTQKPLPSIIPTMQPPLINFNNRRQVLGIGLIAACTLGLVVVGLTAFRKK